MPTTIPDLPGWVQSAVAAMFAAGVGWLTGRRQSNATASNAEADAAGKLVDTALKIAAAASARAEQATVETAQLRKDVIQILAPLIVYVQQWETDCTRCETRPEMPPALAARIKKFDGGGESH